MESTEPKFNLASIENNIFDELLLCKTRAWISIVITLMRQCWMYLASNNEYNYTNFSLLHFIHADELIYIQWHLS